MTTKALLRKKTKKIANRRVKAKTKRPSSRSATAFHAAAVAAVLGPPVEAKKPDTVLVLRVCRPDMTSSYNFKWPTSGEAVAPDWRPTKACGNGLHGWKWGVGDLNAIDYWNEEGAKWLVVEVEKDKVIDLETKVKFERGRVIFCGDRVEAAKLIGEQAPADAGAIMFRTATAGARGTATAGTRGTATAGDAGTATAGARGTATAGEDGLLQILYLDPTTYKYRYARGLVGENGIKPNTAYHVADGKLVEGKAQ